MRKLTSYASLLALLMGLIIAGCSDDPPVGPPDDDDDDDTTEVRPGVGTTYVYDFHLTDSVGGTVAGSEESALFILVDTNASFEGRTGLYLFNESRSGFTWEHYLRPISSGNVEIRLGLREPIDFTIPDFWALVPLGTKTTNTVTLVDSLYTETFVGDVQVNAVVITSYVGEETVTIDGEAMTVQKGRIELKVHLDAFGLADEFYVTEVTEISYAPEIGFLTSRTFTGEDDLADLHSIDKSGEVYTLTSFTIE